MPADRTPAAGDHGMKNQHQRMQAICKCCTEWRSTTRMRNGVCWNCQKKTKKEPKK